MVIGVFADVHGNLSALKAVVEDGKKLGVERWYCCGDMAFKGPAPQECLEFIRNLCGDTTVMGNTEEWLPVGPPAHEGNTEEARKSVQVWWDWTIKRLETTEIEWVKRLPRSLTFEHDGKTCCLTHATMEGIENILLPTNSDEDFAKAMHLDRYDLVGAAHIHTPYMRRAGGATVFNTGSVGRPLDGDNRASYVVLGPGSLSFRRVRYDIAESIALAKERAFPSADAFAHALQNSVNFS